MNAPALRFTYFLIFCFGCLVTSQPVILTFLKSELALSDTQVGLVFTIGALNGIVFGTVAGFIIETTGFRRLILAATILMSAGTVLYGLPLQYLSFGMVLFSAFLFMLGLNGCFLSSNALIAASCGNEKERYLNYTHFCYCVGSLVSPIFMTRFHHLIPTIASRPLGEVWRWNFLINLALALACLVWALRLRFPEPQSRVPFSLEDLKRVLKHPAIYFLMFVLTTYIVADLSLANWMVLYLKSVGFSVSRASLFLSGFFILMALGRLCGGLFINQRVALSVTAVCLAILPVSLFLGFKTSGLLLPVSGLFFAVLFPTLLGRAYNDITVKPFFSVSVIMTGMSAGYTLSQAVIGWLNDMYSVETVLPAVTITCSVLSLIGFLCYLWYCRGDAENNERSLPA